MPASTEIEEDRRETSPSSPTIADTVTQNTPLEDLNLSWTERDLPEKERTKHVHRLHPYLGKFIPQLVEVFLRKYFRPGQTVLEPFSGSGTTLVQANELGIHSIGYDISAFNVLLCRAKLTDYDVNRMREEVLDALQRVRASTQNQNQGDLWQARETRLLSGNEYIKTWFAPRARLELETYRRIVADGNYRYRELLQVILSRSARSARLTTHFDLDFPKRPQLSPYLCYKHSRECSPTVEAFKFLERYSLDAVKRISEFKLKRTTARWTIEHADSRSARIPPVDGIITSPPYVGLIDYHEQHAYSYELLGLEDRRGGEIGPAASGSSEKAKEAYKAAIADVFRNAMKSMPSGSPLIVIAGDRQNLYGDIAADIGVTQEAIVQRHVNRRTGRRSTEFFESVFVWRKP